jgi:hypothetical protein
MNLLRLLFVCMLVFWMGCQRSTDYLSSNEESTVIEHLNLSDEELRQAVAHTPAADIESSLQKVSRTLDLVYAEKMPTYLPNWLAIHAVLMYEDQV